MTLAIVQPLPMAIASTSAGTGAANLLTPHPREAFAGQASGDLSIVIDLGAVVSFDVVFLGFTNAPAGAVVSARLGNGGGTLIGQTAVAQSYRRAPLRHAVIAAAAPVQGRYVTLTVAGAGGALVAVVAAGLSIRPAGHEFGSGRPVSDTSRVDRLFDGGLGINRGATAGGWQWTMPLTDEERDRLYALVLDAGLGSTILVAEDTDGGAGANERYHWSVLTKLEPYARQAPGENTWSMQVQDWA